MTYVHTRDVQLEFIGTVQTKHTHFIKIRFMHINYKTDSKLR